MKRLVANHIDIDYIIDRYADNYDGDLQATLNNFTESDLEALDFMLGNDYFIDEAVQIVKEGKYYYYDSMEELIFDMLNRDEITEGELIDLISPTKFFDLYGKYNHYETYFADNGDIYRISEL